MMPILDVPADPFPWWGWVGLAAMAAAVGLLAVLQVWGFRLRKADAKASGAWQDYVDWSPAAAIAAIAVVVAGVVGIGTVVGYNASENARFTGAVQDAVNEEYGFSLTPKQARDLGWPRLSKTFEDIPATGARYGTSVITTDDEKATVQLVWAGDGFELRTLSTQPLLPGVPLDEQN